MNIAIVGAGILGRMVGLAALAQGWRVTIYDQNGLYEQKSCSFVAAGLLTPVAELEHSGAEVFSLGLQSLKLWPTLLHNIGSSVVYRPYGSIWLAHERDRADFHNLEQRLRHKLNCNGFVSDDYMQPISITQLKHLEPEISPQLTTGLFLPDESCLDSAAVMRDILNFLLRHGADVQANTQVTHIEPHVLTVAGLSHHYDTIFDCRGLGASDDWPELRAIRGEIIWLRADQVNITRPIRLMHPRYPVYIVPYGDQLYAVGASSIESDDMSPVSVQTMFELLSAAYTMHPGFLHARIEKTAVHCRPCLPNAQPAVQFAPGLIRMNGLYRHGYLVTPALVSDVFKRYFGCDITYGLERGFYSAI